MPDIWVCWSMMKKWIINLEMIIRFCVAFFSFFSLPKKIQNDNWRKSNIFFIKLNVLQNDFWRREKKNIQMFNIEVQISDFKQQQKNKTRKNRMATDWKCGYVQHCITNCTKLTFSAIHRKPYSYWRENIQSISSSISIKIKSFGVKRKLKNNSAFNINGEKKPVAMKWIYKLKTEKFNRIYLIFSIWNNNVAQWKRRNEFKYEYEHVTQSNGKSIKSIESIKYEFGYKSKL